jgi:uncharacterized protein YggT (Ycf19 family)
VLIVLKTIGSLIFWVLLVMAIMSWVSQAAARWSVLMQLAEPLLRPIRRLLPSNGRVDFSPMILVLLLYVINMGSRKFQATGNIAAGLWMALMSAVTLRRRSGATAVYSAESQPVTVLWAAWRRAKSRHYRPG